MHGFERHAEEPRGRRKTLYGVWCHADEPKGRQLYFGSGGVEEPKGRQMAHLPPVRIFHGNVRLPMQSASFMGNGPDP